MRPSIVKILFSGENTADRRSITVILSDGHVVDIKPLASFGQKTYHQTGATPDRLWVTVDLAQASIPWLHGDGPRPDIRRFLGSADDAEFKKAVYDYEAAQSAASEATATALTKATDILTGFILRHSCNGILFLDEYFDSDNHDEDIDNIIVAIENACSDDYAWYGEQLKTLAVMTHADERRDILLNGRACLGDWSNRCLTRGIIDMAVRIEDEIAAGKASFSEDPFPGTLTYLHPSED